MSGPGAPFKLRLGGAFFRCFRRNAAAPEALSPHSMFVLLPAARPGIILSAIIYSRLVERRASRPSGGRDAHRSIDVAMGRDKHFLSWIRHAISSAFVRT